MRLTGFACIIFTSGVFAVHTAPGPAERRDRPGPWDQDVLIYRVGTNGMAEQTGKFERAGVATVARLKDGQLLAAHQHFPENNEADFDKVAVHFSSDEGRTWTAAEVIRLRGLPEGMRFPFDPTLVVLPGGRIRLYFTSLSGRRFQESMPAIYSATSTNGIDYEFEPGMRFGIEGRPVIDCAVVLHKGTFHLYSPDNGTGGRRRGPGEDGPVAGDRQREGVGYHAVSKDGLQFQRLDDVRVEGRRRWLGNAQADADKITFFGTGEGEAWMATSIDGERWSSVKVLKGARAADPGAVALKDGTFLVLGTGPPRSGTPSSLRRRPENPQTEGERRPLPERLD